MGRLYQAACGGRFILIEGERPMASVEKSVHSETVLVDGHKILLKLPARADPAVLWKIQNTLFQSSFLQEPLEKICTDHRSVR